MRFSQTEQDKIKEIVAEMKAAREKFSVACKVYQPFMAAVRFSKNPTEKDIVDHFKAHKVYCQEYEEFNAAKQKFDSAMKSQGVETNGMNKQELKKHEQSQMISAKQKAMAFAVLNRRNDETPQQAMDRGEREFLEQERQEQEQQRERGGAWNLGSEEKDDPTFGDFEPLPATVESEET